MVYENNKKVQEEKSSVMQQQMINICVCILQFLKFILNMWYNMVYTIFYFLLTCITEIFS